jgi:hypothetical protein
MVVGFIKQNLNFEKTGVKGAIRKILKPVGVLS